MCLSGALQGKQWTQLWTGQRQHGRAVMSEDGLSDLTEMERRNIINKRITAQLDDMTSSDIMEAYADNLFDWYETWSDDELRELK